MIIFSILKVFLGGAFSFVKGLFTDAFEYPKTAFLILVLAAALVGGLEVRHDFELKDKQIVTLQQEDATLTAQVTQLKLDVANAVAANQQDQITINQLSLAKTDTEQRVQELQTTEAANQTKISNLRSMIANSKTTDDGKVSNVLAETIKAIQANRKAAQ